MQNISDATLTGINVDSAIKCEHCEQTVALKAQRDQILDVILDSKTSQEVISQKES